MKKLASLTALLVCVASIATADGLPSAIQTHADTVTVTAKGHDIRDVLYDLFTQSGKNFVLDSSVAHTLYLNLEKVSFESALEIIVKNGNVNYEVRNGVYFITRAKTTGSKPPVETKTPPPLPIPVAKTKLTAQDLQKKVTTRFSITDIRVVFAEFGKQAGVKIEVDPSVPAYKLDAYLLDTSLKYGLDVVCDATKLKWVATDYGTIRVTKPN